MTQAIDGPAAVEAVEALEFRRTVDRKLAHRAAVSEIFVTDVRPITDRSCLVGVQLPQAHAYYNDHVQEPSVADVLLVLESCRQAAICGAHAAAEIPTGESMLVNTFTVELDEPARLLAGRDPIDLTLETTYIGRAGRSGRIKQGRVEHELFADGVHVGHHEMDVVFVRGTQHDALRRAQRGSLPPSTLDLDAPDPAHQVDPAMVGRVHPLNVVLSDPAVEDGVVTAAVTPHPGNRGLFDHAYDHPPAMTLSEAARQVALLSLAGGTGDGAGRAQAVGVTSRFERFAELDAPLLVSTAVRPQAVLDGPAHVTTEFTQNGATVAETTVTLVPTDQLEH